MNSQGFDARNITYMSVFSRGFQRGSEIMIQTQIKQVKCCNSSSQKEDIDRKNLLRALMKSLRSRLPVPVATGKAKN